MASAEYSVLTPERVSLQYDIAGIGSRGAAAIIDTIIQGLVLVVLIIALSATAVVGAALKIGTGTGGSGTGWVIFLVALYVLAVFVVTAGYYIVFEIVWSGQTPGKRVLGVRVIRENGYPIRPIDAVIRNLVRVVDFLPAEYGLGLIVMLMNKRSKRLGDFAAGTIVVREGSRGSVSAFVTPADSVEARGYALSTADATLVRDFLTRRATLNTRARADLAQRLANALSSRYGLPLESDPEHFLERLAA